MPCAPELFMAELGKLEAGRMTADEKSGLVEKYTSLFWVTAHVLLTRNSLFFFRELWQNGTRMFLSQDQGAKEISLDSILKDFILTLAQMLHGIKA